LLGGGNGENVGENSNLGEFVTALGLSPYEVKEFTSHTPSYWGEQPIVAAPAYLGAVVLFLFILALF